jgi:hypothetical protein
MKYNFHAFNSVHENPKKFEMNYDEEVAKLDHLILSLDESIKIDDELIFKLQSFVQEADRVSSSSKYVLSHG